MLSVLFLGVYVCLMLKIPQKVSGDLEVESDRMYNIAVSVLSTNFKAGSICTTGANFKGYFQEIPPKNRMDLVRHTGILFDEEKVRKDELLDTYKLFKPINNPYINNGWSLIVYKYCKEIDLGKIASQGIMTWVVSPYAVAFRTQQNQYAYIRK